MSGGGLPRPREAACVEEPLAIYAPQDIAVPALLELVRAKVGQCEWQRHTFERHLRYQEDSFCAIESAARAAGYVLVPTAATPTAGQTPGAKGTVR